MAKTDSASKRSVPSPKVHSVRKAMDLAETPGFGSPKPPTPLPQKLQGQNGSKGGGKSGKGLGTKSGYDVKTRVSVGKAKKK